ncbi:protein tyrosine phosphatase domain-containing protein 1 [Lampris incognitus]|uniref:protein tyrosine phosphatase domain-containing protein 1 n=1 Tax=Lampris incognitus TaxID=2546036 RepID=UPI0024B5E7A2|nr:protein tyrosine phosphatase domain-containing protein 1 [Lampris incognitus]
MSDIPRRGFRGEQVPAMAAGVSLLNDLPHSSSGACGEEINTDMEAANTRVPTAKYTKMGETLRHVIPGHMQCSMACGGKACKYENPSRWSDEEQAIKGLYSSWITDNLLAMARPSTDIIDKYNIIEQFQRCGLRTVINLQRPGEHASCGNSLEPESGFTYRPEIFMEAGIYFYNFGWKDYGVASLTTILDMVKVMSFAIQEGKMAVHCHAGLGRTGVLLACYLVFTSRMSADQAILFVRAKRPNSIQTRGQLLCVREFAQFLVPLRNVFSCTDPKANAVTLSQYLTRQRHLLHGYEARQMKNVPKIVQLVCRLLLDIVANQQVVVKEELLEIPDLTAEVEKTVSQQALQQLGREIRGKGIPVPSFHSFCHRTSPILQLHDQPLASDNELDPFWMHQNVESPTNSLLSGKRNLSYSDSALHRLGHRQDHLGSLQSNEYPVNRLIKHALSQTILTVSNYPRFHPILPHDIMSIIQDPLITTSSPDGMQKIEANQDARAPFLENRLDRGHHSLSLGFLECGGKPCCNAQLHALSTNTTSVASEKHPEKDFSMVRSADKGEKTQVIANVPYIALQSETSIEARRLLVAKALAMDLTDKDLSVKVSMWQTELNSREGAWERMCMERDPLVLSCLMWSWLEQLRDPIISSEDVRAISDKNYDPQHALDSLEKGHRLTLLCILNCAAHLFAIPEAVEASLLNQTVKVFTKTDTPSEKNQALFKNLKAILTPVLHEMRKTAMEENENS